MLAMKHGALVLLVVVLLAAPAAAADRCMQFDVPKQIAEGRLVIGHFKDAADRPETAYILRLPAATCLGAEDPEFRVKRTRTIHIYSSDEKVHAQIDRFVGKDVMVRGRPFGAHTAHHHAPIVMEISEIDAI
jgi:Domain of unknown function (DUF4431)